MLLSCQNVSYGLVCVDFKAKTMIHLPQDLLDAIHNAFPRQPQQSALMLRTNYQNNHNHQSMHDTYILSRMPATYAAILNVLLEIPSQSPIKTVLDIGSGPGTGLWALMQQFTTLTHYSGLEADHQFIRLAQILAPKHKGLKIHWHNGVYPKHLPDIKADLVLMSYTLGENPQQTLRDTIAQVWTHNTAEWIVIVEPGTPKGFNVILEARHWITQHGGYIYAPCKGNAACPLSKSDWCHFSTRLLRPPFQQTIKQGTLSYEDEKYSYLIARKSPLTFTEEEWRVIKKPVLRSGHVVLDVCADGTYKRITLPKSQKELYQNARHIQWGDSWQNIKAK